MKTETFHNRIAQLNIQAKPVDSVIEGGAQKQQLINIECLGDFIEAPFLHVQFHYNNVLQKIQVKLPVMLNKFLEPAQMDSATFFQRWKILCQPGQECQKVIKAKSLMDHEQLKAKVVGANLSALEGIDPNPDNFVSAGVIYTTAMQVGCLARLEPNRQAQMYRLTIRASRDGVATHLCDLLETQL